MSSVCVATTCCKWLTYVESALCCQTRSSSFGCAVLTSGAPISAWIGPHLVAQSVGVGHNLRRAFGSVVRRSHVSCSRGVGSCIQTCSAAPAIEPLDMRAPFFGRATAVRRGPSAWQTDICRAKVVNASRPPQLPAIPSLSHSSSAPGWNRSC